MCIRLASTRDPGYWSASWFHDCRLHKILTMAGKSGLSLEENSCQCMRCTLHHHCLDNQIQWLVHRAGMCMSSLSTVYLWLLTEWCLCTGCFCRWSMRDTAGSSASDRCDRVCNALCHHSRIGSRWPVCHRCRCTVFVCMCDLEC